MIAVKRLYDMEKRREIKLKELQVKRLQQESKAMSFTPEISKKSRELAEKNGERNKPFHLRSGEFISKKNAELEQLRRAIEEEKSIKETQGSDNWSSKASSLLGMPE